MTRVTAYQAKDGSLHLEEDGQIFRDIALADKSVADHIQGISTVCSQRTRNRHIAAISQPEEFYEMFAYVFQHERGMVDQILSDLDAGAEMRLRLRHRKTDESKDTQGEN
ncbi:MAG: hypothetical protein ABWX90_02510 [Candidatus Saccharimonadales bacterium]